MNPPRTVLVTGGSSGIGAATVRLFTERGYRALATCRDPRRLPAEYRVPGVDYLPLELGDPDSVQRLLDHLGPDPAVDVLVNNAGISQAGPFEDLTTEQLGQLFTTNVLSQVQLTQGLLPAMRARGHGSVVMVGSMLASFPAPFRSGYVASKAALKGFVLAARPELAPHGVRLTVVEPGTTATGVLERRAHHQVDGSVYAERFAAFLDRMHWYDQRGTPPQLVAERIWTAATAARPRPVYAVGDRAPLVLTFRRLISARLAERLMARRYGVGR